MIGGVQVVVAAPKISQRFVVIMEAYAVTLRKDDMDSILKALSKRSGNSGMTPTVYHWSRDDVVPDKFVAGLKLGPFACCLLEQVSPQFCVLLF